MAQVVFWDWSQKEFLKLLPGQVAAEFKEIQNQFSMLLRDGEKENCVEQPRVVNGA